MTTIQKCGKRTYSYFEIQSIIPDHSFYCTFQNGSLTFFLTRESGLNISYLIECRHRLWEAEAKFYISEVISGLEQLHSLGIVHLDIKPGNIHLAHSDNIMIADYNCDYDLALNKVRQKQNDFRRSRGFDGYKIRNRRLISFAADIFSMGVTMLTLLIGYTPNYEKDDHLNPAWNLIRTIVWILMKLKYWSYFKIRIVK